MKRKDVFLLMIYIGMILVAFSMAFSIREMIKSEINLLKCEYDLDDSLISSDLGCLQWKYAFIIFIPGIAVQVLCEFLLVIAFIDQRKICKGRED